MSPFLELDMRHRRFNRNEIALVQIMGIDRELAVMNSVSWAKLGQAQCSSHQVWPAQVAGLLAHSAGSAGSQLNSAGWSVGSSDQCDSSGQLPGRLVSQWRLWAGGILT
ncbi:hypothetical protein F2Q70_00042929 [Brassica cretica]|uniref:Uncharacterized protein n=1 Tax=Brassica cretica TaxID=69181 RepID=A0A8S9KAJ8_BRACR|nr:hypothetical protein F2Q70_00042929 [Brassica cretica]